MYRPLKERLKRHETVPYWLIKNMKTGEMVEDTGYTSDQVLEFYGWLREDVVIIPEGRVPVGTPPKKFMPDSEPPDGPRNFKPPRKDE